METVKTGSNNDIETVKAGRSGSVETVKTDSNNDIETVKAGRNGNTKKIERLEREMSIMKKEKKDYQEDMTAVRDKLDSEIKAMFESTVNIPDNVEASINIAYDNIYHMTKEEMAAEKASEKRNIFGRLSEKISVPGMARMSLMAAICMIIVVTVVFRQQIIKAAYEGYAYIYGHGPVKAEEENEEFAYIYDGDSIVLGENDEITVKFLYWYKNELTIFTRTLGVVSEGSYDSWVDTPDRDKLSEFPMYINDDKENKWCIGRDKGAGSSMTCYIYETGISANHKIKLTAFGDSVELELVRQENDKDMTDVIATDTSYGSLNIYPVNSKNTAYFFEADYGVFSEDAIVYDNYNDIQLYNGDTRIRPKNYIAVNKFIVVDDDVEFDKIKFRNGRAMAIFNQDIGFGGVLKEGNRANYDKTKQKYDMEFTVPFIKEGESRDIDEHFSVCGWDFDVINARVEDKKYILTIYSDNFRNSYEEFLDGKWNEVSFSILGMEEEKYWFILDSTVSSTKAYDDNGIREVEFEVLENYDKYDKEDINIGVQWIEIALDDIDAIITNTRND